jgi:segregation and condensation protein B
MALKGKLEAIIYAAEEPVTLDQLTLLLKESVITENGLTELEPAAAQAEARSRIRAALEEIISEYDNGDRGMEVREVAGCAKSLKPPIRLSLQALETLSVIAYKQPITAPEISEVRGVDCSGVLGTLIDKKLITTAGRKQVIGRPILYKTTKEFLLRFGLKDITELPSMEEFEKMLSGGQEDLFPTSSDHSASTESPNESSAEQVIEPGSSEPQSPEQPASAEQELTTNDQ